MDGIRVITASALLGLLAGIGSLAHAEDWTTTDGKVYKNVKVLRLQPDVVTILYSEGDAIVPLATLSPELQEKFHYDPDKAKAAATTRAKSN